jgi:hypothetical protein
MRSKASLKDFFTGLVAEAVRGASEESEARPWTAEELGSSNPPSSWSLRRESGVPE